MTTPPKSGISSDRLTVNPARRFERARAELADEHREIMALVDALERSPDASKLIPRLERLHQILISHFAREQFPGGLYESMGAFGSRWHDDLKALIKEHCLILSETRSLLDESRQRGPEERPGLQRRVVELVRMLHDHEHKEHRLASNLGAMEAETSMHAEPKSSE